MKVVATIVHVPYSPGFMMADPEPAHNTLEWGWLTPGRPLVLKEDADRQIAALTKKVAELEAACATLSPSQASEPPQQGEPTTERDQ